MRTFGTVVLAVLGLALIAESIQAQCGCSAGHYSAPVHYAPSYYPPPQMPHPAVTRAPRLPSGPASIAYVNKLAAPIPRANYTLQYAVHLTDGRILLSDFLPPGQVVRGIESQSGVGARRLQASMGGSGAVTIRDPQSDATVAIFGAHRPY